MDGFDLIVNRILDDGRYVVTNNGPDISVGASLQQVTIRRGQEVDASLQTGVEIIASVNLALQTADIYREAVGMVPRGWSAAISFVGLGGELLAKALTDKGEGDRLHLIG
ncbi:hypothetical protein J2W22_000277 [Sphingomonas kyeonggiensis]|uniref:hypothetical protein n=1 Tax=Sphingomonas kyeonggiensis TaxID=1268553 RepID=UPI002783F192|nr:hypothetical protein [Sphingomonas kyeonggiensis]MDQ0248230.1 hypothetical protein [Sphingomonas kyeonggiensis]